MVSFHCRKEILNKQDNSSINDGIQEDVSEIIRSVRKRSHTKDDHKVKEPSQKVQKYSNNPDVQVGSARTLRNRTVVVPDIQPLSETITRTTKATKKPNGKGYSKGQYGEKTIMTPLPKSTKRKSVEYDSIVLSDDEIPELEVVEHDDSKFTRPEALKRQKPLDQPKSTRRKKGSVGTISKKTADATRKEIER